MCYITHDCDILYSYMHCVTLLYTVEFYIENANLCHGVLHSSILLYTMIYYTLLFQIIFYYSIKHYSFYAIIFYFPALGELYCNILH